MVYSEKIKSLGFSAWGYTEILEPISYDLFQEYNKIYPHKLKYLQNERALKRKSLKLIYPEVQSALVVLWDYKSSKKTLNRFNKIASYVFAFEEDYHTVLKSKLKELGDFLQCGYKICVDTESLLEKDLAVRAGLGWIGKNSLLLNSKLGSYTLIGNLLLDKKLELKQPSQEKDHCGQCQRCIESCPTEAIHEGRSLNINQCLSTFTIETFKDEKPPQNYLNSEKYFGCDICQEVCPWNDKPLTRSLEENFGSRRNQLLTFFQQDLSVLFKKVQQLSKKQYALFFQKTAFIRLGKKGLIKNLKHFLTNQEDN